MRPDDLILVIDMQNVYRPGERWGCGGFDRACGNIRAVLDAAARMDTPPEIRFTRFVSNPAAGGVWAEYNAVNRDVDADPWRCALAEELAPYAARYPVLAKSVYSSAGIPEVARLMGRCARLVVTGVVSECCVLSTCMEAVDRGWRVVYLRDGCAGDSAATEQAVETVLSRLSPLHTTLLNTADYLTGTGYGAKTVDKRRNL